MAGPAPLRPLLPLAKRLNQNALVVGAVVLGMTVLTAIVVYPRREAPHAQIPAASDAAPPVPSRPTFLDQPARNPAARFDRGAAGGPGRPGGDDPSTIRWRRVRNVRRIRTQTRPIPAGEGLRRGAREPGRGH
jgi:hypothetical protein